MTRDRTSPRQSKPFVAESSSQPREMLSYGASIAFNGQKSDVEGSKQACLEQSTWNRLLRPRGPIWPIGLIDKMSRFLAPASDFLCPDFRLFQPRDSHPIHQRLIPSTKQELSSASLGRSPRNPLVGFSDKRRRLTDAAVPCRPVRQRPWRDGRVQQDRPGPVRIRDGQRAGHGRGAREAVPATALREPRRGARCGRSGTGPSKYDDDSRISLTILRRARSSGSSSSSSSYPRRGRATCRTTPCSSGRSCCARDCRPGASPSFGTRAWASGTAHTSSAPRC